MSEDKNIQESSAKPHLPETPPETEIIHTEKTDMEIHHHPHAHHKKKWTDYLFEFLMLFMAWVFFVEKQREHYMKIIALNNMQRFYTTTLSTIRLISPEEQHSWKRPLQASIRS